MMQDSIKNSIQEYPNQEQVKMMRLTSKELEF